MNELKPFREYNEYKQQIKEYNYNDIINNNLNNYKDL